MSDCGEKNASDKIRVLCVDDSLTLRERFAEFFSDDGRFEVVGKAKDGVEAIELVRRTRPQVIVMDMMMPRMDGCAATEWIMAHQPTPILVCSASLNRGEVFKTLDALKAGAVDVLEKPEAGSPLEAFGRSLCDAVERVSKIRVITHLGAKLKSIANPGAAQRRRPSASIPRSMPKGGPGGQYRLLAIAASTGGPSAVVRVLNDLGAKFPLPILVLLHLDESFGMEFASWLDTQVPQETRFIVHGEGLDDQRDVVRVVPPPNHGVLRHDRLWLEHGPERNSCRPSADVLFESIALEVGDRAIGMLLTGMGRDGADGLLAMYQAGAHTLVQDEESSLIFGMPKEAIAIGAAREVLALSELGPRARTLASRKPPARRTRVEQ